MYCKLNYGDHPHRLQPDGGTIIHAATSSRANYLTACGLFAGWTWMIRSKDSKISCRNCQKALGFDIKPQTDIRYLVYDKTNELYFLRKNGGGVWVEETFAAGRWRSRESAEEVIKEILNHRGFNSDMPVHDYINKYGCTLVIQNAKISVDIDLK
jgi:hypothetical protein